jgi:uncharacterized protein (DUF58 family)
MSLMAENSPAGWARPGYFRGRSWWRNFWRLCWQLFRPPTGHRTRPTRTGAVLILMSLAIGTAAFNTGHNILYLGLSLLLGSLLVSGVMSWLNFAGCKWRLRLDPHGRVGESFPVAVELRNGKRWLPTYGLAVTVEMPGQKIREQRFLEQRLGPGDQVDLECLLQPHRRGRHAVEVAELFSAFPFGFLQKAIVGTQARSVLIWAPRIDYTLQLEGLSSARRPGKYRSRQGSGAELLNLREYRPGDPMRTVHWKATARLGRLLVRETVDEASAEFVLVVETARADWTEARLDRLAALVSTLAEDLFMAQRLGAVVINGTDYLPVRRVGELHEALGRIALLEPVEQAELAKGLERWVPLTFRPRLNQVEIVCGEEVVGVG